MEGNFFSLKEQKGKTPFSGNLEKAKKQRKTQDP